MFQPVNFALLEKQLNQHLTSFNFEWGDSSTYKQEATTINTLAKLFNTALQEIKSLPLSIQSLSLKIGQQLYTYYIYVTNEYQKALTLFSHLIKLANNFPDDYDWLHNHMGYCQLQLLKTSSDNLKLNNDIYTYTQQVIEKRRSQEDITSIHLLAYAGFIEGMIEQHAGNINNAMLNLEQAIIFFKKINCHADYVVVCKLQLANIFSSLRQITPADKLFDEIKNLEHKKNALKCVTFTKNQNTFFIKKQNSPSIIQEVQKHFGLNSL